MPSEWPAAAGAASNGSGEGLFHKPRKKRRLLVDSDDDGGGGVEDKCDKATATWLTQTVDKKAEDARACERPLPDGTTKALLVPLGSLRVRRRSRVFDRARGEQFKHFLNKESQVPLSLRHGLQLLNGACFSAKDAVPNPREIPQRENGFDCGVFVIAFVLRLVLHPDSLRSLIRRRQQLHKMITYIHNHPEWEENSEDIEQVKTLLLDGLPLSLSRLSAVVNVLGAKCRRG
ncbi:Ulp1 protease family, C-terminal catalytic domain-containing protein [Besnoitia besnoiti]|uniref:Ulp1 protease family, C-terminal catalytic domain-containing protein n=1 Tax=Besnoitia besnoiti TaxID=94643 RepID=A0A2A9M748_BESBE|nr:Ulp1 protease family, C-terminal catalytic domain-containing protein [Besnoitia besnoiti]PFH31467.1 Ulp1 protease family, C-terminal catalytic domain-containing protein [Besnoitia besnoiti]